MQETACLPRYLRFGAMSGGDATLPALAPWIGGSGWYLEGRGLAVDELVLATLLRTIAQCPLRHLCITVYDPRARGPLGRLTRIRNAVPTAFPTPLVDSDSLADRLRQILSDVAADTEKLVSRGIPDMVTEWRTSATPETTLHVVVLLDFPYAIDDPVAELLDRIAEAGGLVRPLLLVASGAPGSSDAPRWVGREAVRLTESDGRWTTVAIDYPYPIDADPAPDASAVDGILEAAVGRAEDDTGPVLQLTNLLAEDIAEPWRHDARGSLDLIFGSSPSGPLELSLRSANPPHPNMLVGGAVGQGKSNLLLDVIYGLATRYSPDELEFHLLDFKEGLEFARFGPDPNGESWLPHVRSLSLESDRPFGTAVLGHFEAEMNRRAELFKEAGQSSISDFRDATGQPMPRLVLVIDEFHELFGGDDDMTRGAVDTMERLARKGRAYGVHLVLASQTLSGIQALAMKEESIFAQFPIRLSLKNTEMESQAILEQGNKAAADLTYRGEVVFNTNFGRASNNGNQIGLAAYADTVALAALQRQLWELGHGSPPTVFLASEPAPWPEVSLPGLEGGVPLWIGRPLGVDDEPRCHRLVDDADQAVAVLGADRAGNRQAIRSMVLTALAGLAGGQLVVLDGDGAEADGWFADIEHVAEKAGVPVVRLSRDDSARFLREDVKDRLAGNGSDGPLLMAGLSIQRLRGMSDTGDDDGDDDDFMFSSDCGSARDVLQQVAQSGANNTVYLIGAWTNLRNAETDMGMGLPGVAAAVTNGLGIEDMRTLVGPHADAVQGRPRLGFYDRTGDGTLEVLVPYAAPNCGRLGPL